MAHWARSPRGLPTPPCRTRLRRPGPLPSSLLTGPWSSLCPRVRAWSPPRPLSAVSAGTMFPHHCFSSPFLPTAHQRASAMLRLATWDPHGVLGGDGGCRHTAVGDVGSGLPAREVTSHLLVSLSLDLRCSFRLLLDPGWAACLRSCLCGPTEPSHDGRFQTPHRLVPCSQEFCLHEAPVPHQELLFKKHVSSYRRSHGLVPKPQGSKVLTIWPFMGTRSPALKSDGSKLGITAPAVPVGALVG